MIKNLRHIGIVVNDLESAISFWINVMGFVVIKKQFESGKHIDNFIGLKNCNVTTVKLQCKDKNQIELLKFHSHNDDVSWKGQAFTTGLTHIAFTVSDLDKILTKIKLNGINVSTKSQFSPDGKVKVIYANGPEGLILELVEEFI